MLNADSPINGIKELNILGLKLTYSKAFGVVFLLIFVLLFFPGIGISSSGLKVPQEEQ